MFGKEDNMAKSFFLMNKDVVVAEVHKKNTELGPGFELGEIYGTLPLGCEDFEEWINNRKAAKHNRHLANLMERIGCLETEGFINLTRAASLNDTFWVKLETDSGKWKDVSLYSNGFTELISRLAFLGYGIPDEKFSLTKATTPELGMEGSFPKCFKKEDNGIFLYKRGRENYTNGGLEPYAEVLSSEFAKAFCLEAVKYELASIYGRTASRCELFTNEETGYVPYYRVSKASALINMTRFFEKIGSEDAFRRMLVSDSIIMNEDRHLGNFGVLVNNDSQEILKIAPAFDFNVSLCWNLTKEDFEHFGDSILDKAPKIGHDFIELGQKVMTDDIRSDLKNLRGFRFSFRGDDKFPAWRVQKMEEIIDRQIEGLISKEKLLTKDIFIPEQQ